MSFINTKTPTLDEIDPRKVRYPVPRRPNAKQPSKAEYYLTPELEELFRKFYPREMNRTIMTWFGISFSTMQRFKRDLGLQKDMAVVRHKQAQLTKRICEKNGYYDSLRGHAPSEQCREASRRKRAEGFHPLRRMKELSPRKYKSRLRRMSQRRKELIETEKRRYKLDFVPLSDLPAKLYAGVHYDSYQVYVRSRARKFGYTVGSDNPNRGERSFIYYDEHTCRCPIMERNATERGGFEFRPLSLRGKVVEIVRGNGDFDLST